ncbi:uncharacterized protein LOC119593410 [Penaeus monodon]|uniref:uncharacterized protein LOC119593410 n=1 Tax=Penaeus monodon TaxID=6687 RepID=UPI0018A786F7|nr:uncharacterized protein LOC119593410 [Penaeus monodon]
MSQDEENIMIEEILQDKKNELEKLQNKILFVDQDIKITKNDIEVEESEFLQILDRYEQQIYELCKTARVSIHKKESDMTLAKEELMTQNQHVKDRKTLGIEFLVRVCQAAVGHISWKEEEALHNKKHLETLCKNLSKEL